MAVHPLTARLTYEDYCAWPEDGRRHEIVDGEHYVSPSPKRKHQSAAANLTATLVSFVRAHQLGQVFPAPFDVLFSDFDVVQPDLVFVAAGNAEIVTEDNIQGTPDLVVEILSESSRKYDLVTKRKLYERFGVREFWVLDPLLETATVYRLENGAFRRLAELSAEAEDILSTPLLPGLVLPLTSLFT
jgi:Uma2 family endonuclease